MRKVHLIAIALITCSCAPAQLPRIDAERIKIPEGARCHGLGVDFHWHAHRSFGEESARTGRAYRFLQMFGYAGHRDLKQTPAYANALFESESNTLRIGFYTKHGAKLAELADPSARVLECGPDKSSLSLIASVASSEGGRSNRRTTVTFTKDPSFSRFTRVHTRTELNSAYLVFRSSQVFEYWAEFEPYGHR